MALPLWLFVAVMALFVAGSINVIVRLRLRIRDLDQRLKEVALQIKRLEPSETVKASERLGKPRLTTLSRADSPKPSPFLGPTLISIPNLAAGPASFDTTISETLSSRFGAVWSRADEGISSEQIALETGYPNGQVELMLGLRGLLSQAKAGGEGETPS